MVLCILVVTAGIVIVDLLFFRHHFLERLIVNIVSLGGCSLLFAIPEEPVSEVPGRQAPHPPRLPRPVPSHPMAHIWAAIWLQNALGAEGKNRGFATLFAATAGGLEAPSLFALLVFVALAGLLLDWRGSVMATALARATNSSRPTIATVTLQVTSC